MDKNRRFVTKAILGLSVASLVSPRLLAKESSSDIILPPTAEDMKKYAHLLAPSIKMDFTDASGIIVPASPAKLEDLVQTPMNAVIDPVHGRILEGDTDKLSMPIASASLNKWPVAMVIVDRLRVGTGFDGKEFTLDTKLPKIWIHEQQKNGDFKYVNYDYRDVAVRDALKASLVASHNAFTMALTHLVMGKETVEESELACVEIVNHKVRTMGLKNTALINVTGLPGDHDYNLKNEMLSSVTTLEDVSKLTVIASNHYPEFREYSGIKVVEIPRSGKKEPDILRSSNPFLRTRRYRQQLESAQIEEMIYKTGTTDDGRGMGAVAKLKEFWVGDVTMGHPHRDSESNKLFPIKERPETVLNGLVRSYEIQADEARRIHEAKVKEKNRPRRNQDPFSKPSPMMIA